MLSEQEVAAELENVIKELYEPSGKIRQCCAEAMRNALEWVLEESEFKPTE